MGPQVAVTTLSTRGQISLRGLTSEAISVGDSGVHGSCMLVSDQFCAWLPPHVGLLGLKIVGVLLQSNKLLSLIEEKLGNECDV